MGWKSTIDITREEAIRLIFERLSNVHTLSNDELGDLLESVGYGDTVGIGYYGFNFNVIDKEVTNKDGDDSEDY